jgi:DNA-binding NarL/FixJ family response regulator
MSFPYALLVNSDHEYAIEMETVLNGGGVHLVCASSPKHALRLTELSSPAAVLLDLDRPMRETMGLLEAIRSRGATPHVLWITSSVTEAAIERVVSSGSLGLLSRDADTVEIVCAVRSILSGEKYFPPAFSNERGSRTNERANAESERIMKLLHSYASDG